jgi:hypothetical protein
MEVFSLLEGRLVHTLPLPADLITAPPASSSSSPSSSPSPATHPVFLPLSFSDYLLGGAAICSARGCFVLRPTPVAQQLRHVAAQSAVNSSTGAKHSQIIIEY